MSSKIEEFTIFLSGDEGSIPRDPLEEGMATTPVFFPGEFHRQRNLAGYIPGGGKESDTMTEQQEQLSLTDSMS